VNGFFIFTLARMRFLFLYTEIAEYFIDSVEKNINNDDLLMSISRNNIDYYDKYLLPNKIVDEFFKVFDPSILE
jgi:hypothetical protein